MRSKCWNITGQATLGMAVLAIEHQGLVPVSYKIFPIFALTKPTDLCIQRQNQKMKRWQPTRKRLNRVWRSLCHPYGTPKNISATPTRCRAILVISRHTLGETDARVVTPTIITAIVAIIAASSARCWCAQSQAGTIHGARWWSMPLFWVPNLKYNSPARADAQ